MATTTQQAQQVAAVAPSAATALVHWAAPSYNGGVLITTFFVTASKGAQVTSTTTSSPFTDLTPFTVVAVSVAGARQPSGPSTPIPAPLAYRAENLYASLAPRGDGFVMFNSGSRTGSGFESRKIFSLRTVSAKDTLGKERKTSPEYRSCQRLAGSNGGEVASRDWSILRPIQPLRGCSGAPTGFRYHRTTPARLSGRCAFSGF
jgi:hypothetical protein